MRLVSLNIGRPVLVSHAGRQYSTAINRHPAAQSLRLTTLGFEGDRVADAEHHGGPDRAACCYPWEHYAHWSTRLGVELPVPSFGENLTTVGLLEDEICIGDRFSLGEAVVQVSQPRQPCYKLANKLGSPQLPAWITERAFTGFYVRVLHEGNVAPDSAFERVDRPNPGFTVARVALALLTPAGSAEERARLAELPELSAGWRQRAARARGAGS